MTPAPGPTMRAVQLTGHGGLDRLRVTRDAPVPVAGPGEVLVRLRASAVNNTDIATRTAWYARGDDEEAGATKIVTFSKRSIAFPRIQGAGGVGIVAAAGEGVPAGRLGEIVLVDPFIRDASLAPPAQLSIFMGSGCDGCFADYVTVPAENAIPVRSKLTFAELACLPVAYQTAEEMLDRAGVADGDRVIVTGASGGVGAAAVALAAVRGAQILAVAGAPKREAVLALGAHQVAARDDDIGAASTALWGEAGVDVVIDVVGGPGMPALLGCLRRGGHLVCAGAIAGPSAELDLRVLIYRDLKVSGVGTSQPGALQRLAALAEEGRLRPAVSRVFPLEDLASAQEAFLSKTHVGKICIDIHRADEQAAHA